MMNRNMSYLILVFLLLFGFKDSISEAAKHRDTLLDDLNAQCPNSMRIHLTFSHEEDNFSVLGDNGLSWRPIKLPVRPKQDREILGPRDQTKSKGFFSTMLIFIPHVYFVYHLICRWIGYSKSDERNRSIIGKLVVGEKIANGSNGTVVYEGKYDGREAVVKRLVKDHYDADAIREIENLKSADSHINIVRLYGWEVDCNFVYLALERCDYTLYDLIQLKEASPFKLWGPNGYPTSVLLELMKNIVAGLEHMHKLGIIHRDLKPHNVLIDKVGGRCKLSDMGISRRLGGGASSLGPHATVLSGSSGWRSREQIHGSHQTRAMDLFSLGCVLFYFMTGGSHPFGACFKDDTMDRSQRDIRVINNDFNLFLVKHISEAVDLFSGLLEPYPERRPVASKVLHHPLFWNSEMRMSFLSETSDILEPLRRHSVLGELESKDWLVFRGRWDVKLEPAFIRIMERWRLYDYQRVRQLLRIIRNVNHHHNLAIENLLGSLPQGCDDYFRSKFPKLLMEVYNVMNRCPNLGSKWYREKYFGS